MKKTKIKTVKIEDADQQEKEKKKLEKKEIKKEESKSVEKEEKKSNIFKEIRAFVLLALIVLSISFGCWYWYTHIYNGDREIPSVKEEKKESGYRAIKYTSALDNKLDMINDKYIIEYKKDKLVKVMDIKTNLLYEGEIEFDEIKPSNIKYPYIDFKPDREQGKEVLEVKNISKTINGEKILDNISFTVKREDKISLLSDNEIAKTVLFQILAGEMEPDEGELVWGTTISKDYFPKDNNYMFNQDVSITDWLRQYSKDPDETYVRSFLGRMLFSGEEALKKVEVLSGGEKVRCVLSKLMLSGANFLIFDEPTNHLDMESITALNDGMQKYKGIIMFTSNDHKLTQTVANKIIDITNNQVIVRECTYDEYLEEQENV